MKKLRILIGLLSVVAIIVLVLQNGGMSSVPSLYNNNTDQRTIFRLAICLLILSISIGLLFKAAKTIALGIAKLIYELLKPLSIGMGCLTTFILIIVSAIYFVGAVNPASAWQYFANLLK